MADHTINTAFKNYTWQATLSDKGTLGTLTITTDGTTPRNLTGSTFVATCKPSPGATPTFPIAVSNAAPTTGVLTLSIDLTAATEPDVTPGTWWWNITETAGSVVTTFSGGPFIINAKV